MVYCTSLAGRKNRTYQLEQDAYIQLSGIGMIMQGKIRKFSLALKPSVKINVAAYARVSSGKDAMLQSLAVQVSSYSRLPQTNDTWQYAGVYTDEAKTGTKETGDNFQRLINDCRQGKIDMIITKSISRFARNTVTLLKTVRELKEFVINVYFEEQNIHFMSSDEELMLAILASYAQKERLSASENQKWRIQNGILPMNKNSIYGYKGTPDGDFVMLQDEAQVIRYIHSCISGLGVQKISKELNARGILIKKVPFAQMTVSLFHFKAGQKHGYMNRKKKKQQVTAVFYLI